MHVAIIGSGFSGSILAWILASQGVRVSLIDAQTHPRFAIGESSTPIADALLRRLGETYDLKPLVDLSTYGTWKKTHPRITCGKKRGFSYYHHDTYHPNVDGHFREDNLGDHSLLVAASKSDQAADTHWYRSEVDEYFFQQAILSGVQPYSATSVVDIASVGNQTRLLCGGNFTGELIADYVIDASGSAAVTATLLGKPDLTSQLRTHTSATFGHYRGVRSWTDYLQTHGFDTSQDPFDADDAAQHHVTPDGWTWMLRFENDITSVGFVSHSDRDNEFANNAAYQWMMQDAEQTHPTPGDALIQDQRIQRYHDPIVAERIWMLPTAAVTLDPLHSTGIAHALAGVDRIAAMLLKTNALTPQTYAKILHDEVTLLDQLVSTAYAVIADPARFHAACMLYFAAAITCEEKLNAGHPLTHLYTAGDSGFRKAAETGCRSIRDRSNRDFAALTAQQIAAWNTAGLLNPETQNRYAYTATKA